MITLKISEAMDMVRHVAINLNEPLMLWGPPGSGKLKVWHRSPPPATPSTWTFAWPSTTAWT